MCVIAYKPQGAAMPEYEKLKNCFENNDDGAGYMFADNGKVHIVKGLMTLRSFVSSLTETVRRYGKDRAYVLHFRLSTQAGVRKDCTHPFPLSKKMADLRKLKTECDIGIAHNGIIDLTSSLRKDLSYSDTMEFITEYMSLIVKNRDYYKNPDTLKLIEKLTDSKFAVLDGAGHCELIGNGWVEDNGVFYSNDGFMEKFYQYPFLLDDGIHYGRHYNAKTGFYEFNEYDCPVRQENEYGFCGECAKFKDCYGGDYT